MVARAPGEEIRVREETGPRAAPPAKSKLDQDLGVVEPGRCGVAQIGACVEAQARKLRERPALDQPDLGPAATHRPRRQLVEQLEPGGQRHGDLVASGLKLSRSCPRAARGEPARIRGGEWRLPGALELIPPRPEKARAGRDLDFHGQLADRQGRESGVPRAVNPPAASTTSRIRARACLQCGGAVIKSAFLRWRRARLTR